MTLRPANYAVLVLISCLLAGLNVSAAEPPIGDAWSDSRNPIRILFGDQRIDLWSLRPISTPTPAPSGKPRLSDHPIDQLVPAATKEIADRRTLARRLYFSLIGLPPDPDTVARFEQDTAPDAYEQLVDRLLSDPRYGEHQARWWLDIVRYSDSNGFDWDEFRPLAWKYRDYVVRSFNADKPFDQFAREQLAGDELLEGPPNTPAEQDALIATGYLRIGPQDNSASLFNEQDRARTELLADLTETTGTAFLGLTLSCCRCHDHKTEPLSHADHFRFRAFFAGVRYGDDLRLDLAEDQIRISQHNEVVDASIKTHVVERDRLLQSVREMIAFARRGTLEQEEKELLDKPTADLDDESKVRREDVQKKIQPNDEEIRAALQGEVKARHDALSQQIETLSARRLQWTKGLLMTDASDPPPVTRIHFQGNLREQRAEVVPGFPSMFDPGPAPIVEAPNPNTHGRRLTLANWIVSPQNPLTARVLANRIWKLHFGSGIVATPNDFGHTGARPTHPELLDWLADDLVSHGWSIKQLHRRIVTSTLYRQAAFPVDVTDTTDISPDSTVPVTPLRRTLSRLTAEQLRDSLLAVSGNLLQTSGGPPIWPDLPPEILQANPAFLDDNSEKTKGWYPSPIEKQSVRTLYLVQKRTVRAPFLETFDLPENSVSCGRREESTVAPQAFALLNDPEVVRLADAFAERIRAEVDVEASLASDAWIHRAYELALQRPPSPEEHAACSQFLKAHSLPALTRALFNLNEFIYVD